MHLIPNPAAMPFLIRYDAMTGRDVDYNGTQGYQYVNGAIVEFGVGACPELCPQRSYHRKRNLQRPPDNIVNDAVLGGSAAQALAASSHFCKVVRANPLRHRMWSLPCCPLVLGASRRRLSSIHNHWG